MKTAENVDPAILHALRREGLDSVEGAFAFRGGDDLNKPRLGGRRRTRLQVVDSKGVTRALYLKRYAAQTFRQRLRRWLTRGGGPASVEFANVLAARAAGLPTMEAIACDEERRCCGAARGYAIFAAVPGDALERVLDGFLDRHQQDGAVEQLTMKLAALVRDLHASGCVHRDLYASHIFMDESGGKMDLYLIDLARMFRPRWRRFRWVVKDLAQLKYSMPDRWVDRYWDVFLSAYLGDAGGVSGRLARAIDRKVARIRRHSRRRSAAEAAQR